MKAGVPWSVKGIEPETRAAAKAAARRAGMTLGEWLSLKINEPREDRSFRAGLDRLEAFGAGEGGEPESLHGPSYDWTDATDTDLDPLIQRLDRIESQHGDAIAQVESAISVLAQRFKAAQTAPTNETLERRVAKLELGGAVRETRVDNALNALDERLVKISSDSRAAAQTFEMAMGAVAKRLGGVEQRQREHGQLLEQAVLRLSEGLSAALQKEDDGQTDAVRSLEHAVEEITRHFESLESRRETTQQLVESALSALADRIADADRKLGQSQQDPTEAIDRAVERMQSRLHVSERRTADALAAFDARLRGVTDRLQLDDDEFRASRAAMAIALGNAQQTIDGLTQSRGTPPLEEITPEDDEPQTLAELASEVLSHGERRSPAQEEHEEAVPPHRHAEPLADDEKSADDENALSEESISDEVKALVDAARVIARAEDPEQPQHERGSIEPAPSPEATADEHHTSAQSLNTQTLSTLLGVPTLRAQAYEDQDDERRAVRWKGVFIVLGLLAGTAVGTLWLQYHNTSADRLSATRPGLVPTLVDAVRRLGDDARGMVEGLGAPKAELKVSEPIPSAPSKAPISIAPAPQGAPQIVRTVPAPPAVDAKPAAPALSSQELHAFAGDAIKALKASQTAAEEAEAAKRVGRAAALGDADAQFALGRLFETGRSVKHDPEQARRWYMDSAANGNPEASFNLGMMEIASGGDGAYERAARHFLEAAERGNVDAQVNLGLLYEQGLGVPRDDAKARDWYEKAALRGDPEAARARDRLAKRPAPAP